MARNRSWLDGGKAKKVLKKTNGRCYYCGCYLPEDTHIYDEQGKIAITIRNWDVDHDIPVSRGGENGIANLLPSCKDCNRKKGNRTSDEYLGSVI